MRGLVVGKFCPLHLGHVHLIERAAAACERLTIVSYTIPAFPGCARAVREQWIRALFPGATALVIDQPWLDGQCAARGIDAPAIPHNDDDPALHRDFVGWLCWTLLHTTVDAVFTSEDYGDGFALALSNYFSARTSHAGVRHVCVDPARATFPVSGTLARADVHAARALLPPLVYASFVERIGIIGGESSGKTALARALAAHFGTAWVAEYGRELWERQGGELHYPDMLHIAQTQRAREHAASAAASRFLFCDTTPLTTRFYSEEFGAVDPELEALAGTSYAHVLLCAPDFPFVQDGTRRGESFRTRQHAWYLEQLARRAIPYTLLKGSLAERIAQVAALLKG